MKVGHIVIAAPASAEDARQRLQKMGIVAHVMRAVTPRNIAPVMVDLNYATFSGSIRPRTVKEHGIALAHISALNYARSMNWDWAGFWEDDADGVPGIGWEELHLPNDCGVLYLGGALWWPKESYGRPLGGNLWQVTAPIPISGAHAFMVHRRAIDDVMDAYCEMTMTLDDLLSSACINAQRENRWSTCFVAPWMAWQQDRPETWPLTEKE